MVSQLNDLQKRDGVVGPIREEFDKMGAQQQAITDSIVKRAKFESLYRQIRPRAYAHALMLTRNVADAEDLLMTAVVRAWSSFDQFDHARSFGKWLCVIVNRSFLDRKRMEGRRVKLLSWETPLSDGEPFVLDLPEAGPSLEDRIVERESYGPLREALAKIPEEFRRVVVLCDLFGFDYHDCATKEGIPVGTVRSRLYRGRRKLRQLLGDNGGLMAA